MYYDILDKKRIEILSKLKVFKDEFYLAGGTALALQIGHRDSVDFDFFKKDDLDSVKLFSKLKEIFKENEIIKIQEERNTLSIIVDKTIMLSFFSYDYKLLKEKKDEENLSLASIEDIACMKLSAILSRSTNKDYIDLYYIFQDYELKDVLDMCEKKFPDIDRGLILKSVVYFEDVEIEPINFKHNKQIEFDRVKIFLEDLVKKM